MPRSKPSNIALAAARRYIRRYMPELHGAALEVTCLDGPPGSPSYAVVADLCYAEGCERGRQLGTRGALCPLRECARRRAVRLLLDRGGRVVRIHRSGLRWSKPEGPAVDDDTLAERASARSKG